MLISILLNTQEGPSAHLQGFHSTPLSFLVCVLWTPDALSSVQVPLPGNAQGCTLGGPQAGLVSFPSGIALLYCCAQCLRNHVLAVVGVASLSLRSLFMERFLFCVLFGAFLLLCFYVLPAGPTMH